MCLLILNKQSQLKREILKQAAESNDDGFGLAYVEDGMLKVANFLNFKKFLEKYRYIRKKINTPIILHFRLATQGHSIANLHPFLINKDCAFAHNGVMSELYANDLYSDTYTLKVILKLAKYDFSRQDEREAMFSFVKKIAGYGNKLAFLFSDNSYKIINEESGHWVGDTWFSNHSYEKTYYSWYNSGSRCSTNSGRGSSSSNSRSSAIYNGYDFDDYNFNFYRSYNDKILRTVTDVYDALKDYYGEDVATIIYDKYILELMDIDTESELIDYVERFIPEAKML